MHTAVILVGGKGSRLLELTENFPKPMLSIGDEPFLIMLMKNINRFGIEKFILLSGHAHEVLEEHFKNNYYNFDVKLVPEKEPLGTGGAIKNALKFLPKEFFCFNGDSILLGNWLKIKDLINDSVDVSIALTETNDSSRYGGVTLSQNNFVRSFNEKSSGSKYINAGIYFLRKKIFEKIDKYSFSLESDIFPNLVNEKKIKAKKIDGYFIDIGLKDDLNRARLKKWNRDASHAVIFDRDGTLIDDKGYTYKVSDLKIKDYVSELILDLNNKNILVFVATNQSGVARGYFTENDINIFHRAINNELYKNSSHIDKFYYSPYHPDGCIKKYKIISSCRKPGTGMLEKISKDWKLTKDNMLMVGDKKIDIDCAKNFGIKSFQYSDKINVIKLKNFIYESFKI